jgi:probable phosphoglycerate mutase
VTDNGRGIADASRSARPAAALIALPTSSAVPRRRRIYLMRHGAVDYFRADGSAVPPATVSLNTVGRGQARAAGALFRAGGVCFDRVVTSGLARTAETAAIVLAEAGQEVTIEAEPALEEIRPGRLADIPRERVHEAFLGSFAPGGADESHRFIGGESIGELLDRVLPAFERLLADPAWTQLLLVLHGGVNRALLSRAISGARAFFGGMEQLPACINIVDVGAAGGGAGIVVRAINLAPTQWLQQEHTATTMEQLLAEYLRTQVR